jgi:hypothetical protein
MTAPVNPHFASVESWKDAASMLSFEPRRPSKTGNRPLQSLSIFVRDHKHRDLRVEERSLEAHYGAFGLSQSRKGEKEARRWVVEIRYGRAPVSVTIAGHEGRAYELGPEPPPDDIDGRSPAVVVWHDAGMHFLVASGELEVEALLEIAESMYA